MADDLRRFFESLGGTYAFEHELGAGGMAVVWLAVDLRHQRRVAVKLLRPQLLVDTARERFLREIGFLAGMSHPNILPLLDSGEATDRVTGAAVPFFTMPHVAGESLQQLLRSRGPLPIAEIVAIVGDVSAALDYAHEAGIVHRDIKPGNVLLSSGRAVVADFGIARALDVAVGHEAVTETGMRVGTLPYVAPEPESDPRSDQYSLGCMVFEMLSGRPPFQGTPASILAGHLVQPPPSIRQYRPDCPPAVEAAVHRALAKRPDERFASAGDFAAALEAGSQGATTAMPVRTSPSTGRWLLALSAVAGLVLLAAVVRRTTSAAQKAAERAATDSMRFVVVPSQSGGDGAVDDELLREALLRWNGITVVDPFQAREVVARVRGRRAMTPSIASAIAGELGAGRYVVRQALDAGDSVRLRLALYETASNRLLGERMATLPQVASADRRELLRTMVDSLLLAGARPGAMGTRPAGTSSLPALESFAAAGTAIGDWDLRRAEAGFDRAARQDPGFEPAALWLALVRSWLGASPATWRPFVLRAEAGAEALSERDQGIVRALRARSAGAMDSACTAWRALAATHPQDFVSHYGLADCLVHDVAVVRDRTTRSGWRFRAEHGEASAAYSRAFALFTPIYRSLDADAPGAVRGVYQARFQALRSGRAAAPDTGFFLAEAALDHDTIAFVPHPAMLYTRGASTVIPGREALEGATRELRRRHFEAITAWVDARPGRAEPLAALASVLEQMGDRTAVDTLRRARTLTDDADLGYRLAVAEVRLRLRAAIPADLDELSRVRAMADSLLRARGAAGEMAQERASLAALTGRGALAASLWRHAELAERQDVPRYLMGDGPALLVTAAMGGPADSLVALERRVAAAIDREFADPDRLGDRLRWLAPACAYAWPHVTLRATRALAGQGDPVIDAIVRLAEHDSTGALAVLADYSAFRAASGQSVMTLDALPTEPLIRWEAGDRAGALALLDGTLGALFGLGPGAIEDPMQAAGLVRAAALRARFAHESGDAEEARRWGTVVRILWSDADAALAPVVRGAVELARTTEREGT